MTDAHEHDELIQAGGTPTVGELINMLSGYDRDKHVALAIIGTPAARDFLGEGYSPHLYVFDDLYGDGDHHLVAEFNDIVLAPVDEIAFPNQDGRPDE